MDLDIDDELEAGPSNSATMKTITQNSDPPKISSSSSSSRKRHNTDNTEPPLGKVFVSSSEEYDNYSPLLNLSDEVLLEIFQNCNSVTLDAVSL